MTESIQRIQAKDNSALTNNASLVWSVAEILRGDIKQSEYQKVVLPFTVLRRLDAVRVLTGQPAPRAHARRSPLRHPPPPTPPLHASRRL